MRSQTMNFQQPSEDDMQEFEGNKHGMKTTTTIKSVGVERAMNQLCSEIECLEDLVKMLSTRLAPVLGHERSCDSEKQVEDVSAICPLSDDINASARRVRITHRRIESLLSDLEI